MIKAESRSGFDKTGCTVTNVPIKAEGNRINSSKIRKQPFLLQVDLFAHMIFELQVSFDNTKTQGKPFIYEEPSIS